MSANAAIIGIIPIRNTINVTAPNVKRIHWNADYRKVLGALVKYLGTGTSLKPKKLTKAAKLSSKLHSGSSDTEPAQLAELAVRWILKKPNPVPMGNPDYKR